MWWHMRRNQISSFARNGPVHLNQPGGGRQFIRLLAAEVCGISGSNAGYTVFRGSVKGTWYPLHSPVSPFTSPPVRHRVLSHFSWTLPRILHKLCRMIDIDNDVNRTVNTSLSAFRASQFGQAMTAHNSVRVTMTLRHLHHVSASLSRRSGSSQLHQTFAWYFVHAAEMPETAERALDRVMQWNYRI